MRNLKFKYLTFPFLAALMCASTSCFKPSESKDHNTMMEYTTEEEDQNIGGYEDETPNISPAAPKPTMKSMPYDFIGRSVTEGTDNGYYPRNWTYIIEDGDIMDLKIEDVIADDSNQYVAVIRLKLRGTTNNEENNTSNYYYDTKVKIRYVNQPKDGWTLDFVNSLGMKIVSDGAYDDLIIENHDESHSFNNNGDIPLTVGGRYLKDNEWHKYLVNVPPHSQSAPLYDGVMFARYVDDSKIDFVIR